MTVLRGRGCLAKKINITFCVENEVLNSFHLTIFLKQTIFSKITFGGITIFEGKGRRTTKMNIYSALCQPLKFPKI